MQTAGSQSWRLEVSDSDLAVMALFVRDAVGLVATAAVVPPALNSPVADLRGVLSARDGADASVQWLSWWVQILDVEFARGVDAQAAVRAVSDPPEFTVLAHAPQLQAAVQASFDDASRWRRLQTARQEGAFEWDLIKQAVDDVAFDRQVPVHTCSAKVVVLPVMGPRWRRIAPGQVLCSETAARNPEIGYRIAYDVFDSSVGR